MSEFDVIIDRSQHELITIPPEILNLYNLRMLYLQGNCIKVLPDDFFTKLSKLKWLDLRDNQLIAIPKSIREHQRLENLLLSNNQLESLPNELGFVPKLKVLQVSNNPLKYPDRTVIVQGTKAICEYLRNQDEKHETNNEAGGRSENHQSDTNKLTMKDSCSNTDHFSTDQAVIPIKNTKTNYKEIVHNISRNASKILLKSSCSFTNEKNMKNLWMDKLKTLLMEQEKILQQEKNLQMLTNWKRNNRKSKSVPKLRQQPPFGTDLETVPKQSTSPNVEDLMQNLTEQLQHIENLQDNSDRNNIDAIGQQIKAIMTIHKKLKHIKSNHL